MRCMRSFSRAIQSLQDLKRIRSDRTRNWHNFEKFQIYRRQKMITFARTTWANQWFMANHGSLGKDSETVTRAHTHTHIIIDGDSAVATGTIAIRRSADTVFRLRKKTITTRRQNSLHTYVSLPYSHSHMHWHWHFVAVVFPPARMKVLKEIEGENWRICAMWFEFYFEAHTPCRWNATIFFCDRTGIGSRRILMWRERERESGCELVSVSNWESYGHVSNERRQQRRE